MAQARSLQRFDPSARPPADLRPSRAGAGSFGRVSLARHISSGRTVAIKAMSKAAIIRENQVQHTLDERSMLAKVSGYPFLINMLATFQVRDCERARARARACATASWLDGWCVQ